MRKSDDSYSMIRENSSVYSADRPEKLFSIDDYYALPDDRRVELIDGVFYDMASPGYVHQAALGELYSLFRECIQQHHMACQAFVSPCDVRLDKDDYTMVQPDMIVICGKSKSELIRAARYEGAPDLVVEILSPSTQTRDQYLKLHKYRHAGVREYWIVDIDHQTVIVHRFGSEDDCTSERYSFTDTIPAAISDGRCSIDFSRVLETIREYYDN